MIDERRKCALCENFKPKRAEAPIVERRDDGEGGRWLVKDQNSGLYIVRIWDDGRVQRWDFVECVFVPWEGAGEQ